MCWVSDWGIEILKGRSWSDSLWLIRLVKEGVKDEGWWIRRKEFRGFRVFGVDSGCYGFEEVFSILFDLISFGFLLNSFR